MIFKQKKPIFTINKKGVLVSAKAENIECIEVPDTAKEIGKRAFNNCSGLKKIILPESIQKIHAEAFYRCASLEEINIPAGVAEISPYAFALNCPETVTLGAGDVFAKHMFACGRTVPVPYIECTPVPLDINAYRTYFAENPQIKRVFAPKGIGVLAPVSVDEFLSAIEEACASEKLYIREGHRMSADTYTPITPDIMVFDGGKYAGVMFDYTEISYSEDRRGDLGQNFTHYTKILKPEDGVVANVYDTYERDAEETAELIRCIDGKLIDRNGNPLDIKPKE